MSNTRRPRSASMVPNNMNRARSQSRSRYSRSKSTRRTTSIPQNGFSFTNVNFGVAFNDILNSLTSMPFRTAFLVVAFLSAFIIMSSGPKYDHGIISTILGSTNNTLTQWLHTNPNDFTGLLIALPFGFAVPQSSMVGYMVASFCFVSVVPEMTVITYAILFFCLFMLFRTNNRNTKVALFIVAVVAYLTGWLVFGQNIGVTLPANNDNMTIHSFRR